MPTRNVSLTPELDRFIVTRVENGRYENASEVVRAALRILERQELEYESEFTEREKQAPRFRPVPVRGEPVSVTILNDRGTV